jgi:hypothetical protein
MKINLNKGIVTLTSETDDEAITLFQFSLNGKKEESHNCAICGRHFANDIGLRTHKSLGHKIKSKNYERNHRIYMRAKAKRAEKLEVKPFEEIWK